MLESMSVKKVKDCYICKAVVNGESYMAEHKKNRDVVVFVDFIYSKLHKQAIAR